MAIALENYTPVGGYDMWRKIRGIAERGAGIIALRDVTWEEQYEMTGHIVAATNLPSYTSDFSFEPYIKNRATLWTPQELGADLGQEFNYLQPWPFIDIPVRVELTEAVDLTQVTAEFQNNYGAELERLRRELQDFGADSAVLEINNWQFSTNELGPGSYAVTIDGPIGLTDPSQPASEAHFLGIEINLAPGGPS